MEKKNEIPTGRFSRAALTGVTATKLGAKQLAHVSRKVLKGKAFTEEDQKRHEEELGRLLFKTLGMLRGTAIKLSQALSQEADLLPESLRKELAKACHKVAPLNRALIRKVFLKEWGVGPERVFREFDSQAFAAASLGQVHEAVGSDGRALAVKVQYPGIGSTIKSDVRMMRAMLSDVAGRTGILPRRELIDEVLDEIEERLREEIDYRNEARNIEFFRKNVTIPGIRFPEVVEESSGDFVLSMVRLNGVHIDEWVASNPSQDERDRVGQLLFDFLANCFHDLNCIHADPHPGNFLVLENGDLAILDFGCVKKLDPDFTPQIGRMLRAVAASKDESKLPELIAVYREIGFFGKNLDLDEYMENIHPVFRPYKDWLGEPYQEATFDFGRMSPLPNANLREGLSLSKQMSGFPKDYIYFERSYYGLISLLRKLGARVKTAGMIDF